MRKTREQASETRMKILQVAEKYFIEIGYNNVTLQSIAAEAGVTTGALQWHFKDKIGVLLAIRDSVCWPILALSKRTADNSLDNPKRSLVTAIEKMLHDCEHNKNTKKILYIMAAQKEISKIRSDNIGLERLARSTVYNIFKGLEESGEICSPWTSKSAAQNFFFSLQGLYNDWLEDSRINLSSDGVSLMHAMLNSYNKTPNKTA